MVAGGLAGRAVHQDDPRRTRLGQGHPGHEGRRAGRESAPGIPSRETKDRRPKTKDRGKRMTAGPEPLKVLSQKRIADRHFIIELESPRIARSAKPGQFVQVRLDESSDPLLPRPFSFLDASKKSFRILYQVVGKGTLLISEKKPGDRLLVLGPLGNGFSWRPKTKDQRQKTSLVLVGGGVGIPPLYHLAKTVLEDKKSGFEKPRKMFASIGPSLKLSIPGSAANFARSLTTFWSASSKFFSELSVLKIAALTVIKSPRVCIAAAPTVLMSALKLSSKIIFCASCAWNSFDSLRVRLFGNKSSIIIIRR